MKKRVHLLMAVVVFLVTGIALMNSCSKTDDADEMQILSDLNLTYLNGFRPPKNEIRNLYYRFLDEISQKKGKETFKNLIEAVDRQAHEAVWLMETTLNTELGFFADSISEVEKISVNIILTNKSFTPMGVPIIDGNELLSKYLEIESTIHENELNGHLFWSNKMEIVEVNLQNTVVEMTTIGGEDGGDGGYITPLPPGAPIDPFPSGYWNYATGAEYDFWKKTRSPGYVRPAPGYIIEFYNSFFKSAYISQGNCDFRLLVDYGHAQTYVLNTSMMNQYLYSGKEVIDENNPHQTTPELFIGYYAFQSQNHNAGTPNCWQQSSPYPWFTHKIVFYIYETIWVGIPD